MVTFLLATGGHKKVMQAFDYLRAMMKEKTRFQLLISSLTNEPVEPTFQVGVLPHGREIICKRVFWQLAIHCISRENLKLSYLKCRLEDNLCVNLTI